MVDPCASRAAISGRPALKRLNLGIEENRLGRLPGTNITRPYPRQSSFRVPYRILAG